MCRKLVYVVSFVLMLGLVGVASGVEGLLGEYFHGSPSDPWQNLVMERQDPTVDFSWGDGSPEQGIVNANGFTVRWMGEIEPKRLRSAPVQEPRQPLQRILGRGPLHLQRR